MSGRGPGGRPAGGPRRRPPPGGRTGRRERGTDAGLGGDQVEGRRAVLELLRAGTRRARVVWMSNALDPSPTLDEIERRAGLALRRVAPERVAAVARTETHQGVVAATTALRPADVDVLLAAPDALLVALDGVTDPHNLGAVLRVAETAGATGVVVPRHRSARITPTVTKVAAGAIEHLPIARVAGVPALLERARRAGVWTVGLDADGPASLFELELLTEPVVVVLGAEGRGLARLSRERCDVVARIPMAGRLASLNVAAAATLACFEVARRRAAAHG